MFTRWRLFVRDCCMQWWRQPVGTQGDNSQKQMQQEFIAIVLEIHNWKFYFLTELETTKQEHGMLSNQVSLQCNAHTVSSITGGILNC